MTGHVASPPLFGDHGCYIKCSCGWRTRPHRIDRGHPAVRDAIARIDAAIEFARHKNEVTR